MTRDTILGAFRARGCHAYQAELAADFLAEGAASHHLLITPAGLGKVLTASQIVRFMAEHGQARRVLVVAPSAFCMLWRSRLDQLVTQIPVQFMYGRDFHGQADGMSMSPDAAVVIVPCDTAMRPDVRPLLTSTSWDMVILSEVRSHSRCQSLDLYRQMISAGAAKRSLLIASSPLDAESACEETPLPDFQVTNWHGEISDWSGSPIKLPPVKWSVLEYVRTEPELQFQRVLHEQLTCSQSAEGSFLFETRLLVRRAASSLYAAHRTLEILSRKLGRASLSELSTISEKQTGDPTEVEDVPHLSFSPEARKSYLNFLQEAFDLLRQVSTDAKLERLLELLSELAVGRPGRICVLGACADTISYLHQALSERGYPSATINGGLSYAERQQAMKDFVGSGGILLATPGALGEESDLNRVRHVVHYDLPANPSQLAQLEGRFGRISRKHACRMYALEDLAGVVSDTPPIEELLTDSRELVREHEGAPA